MQRAPFVRLADRYAAMFLPVTLLVAGGAWAVSGNPVRFLAVMVVATPCPLILAAPIALVAGVSRGARGGLIVKGAGVIERLGRVRTVLFDKTGTLTAGTPTVSRRMPTTASAPTSCCGWQPLWSRPRCTRSRARSSRPHERVGSASPCRRRRESLPAKASKEPSTAAAWPSEAAVGSTTRATGRQAASSAPARSSSRSTDTLGARSSSPTRSDPMRKASPTRCAKRASRMS